MKSTIWNFTFTFLIFTGSQRTKCEFPALARNAPNSVEKSPHQASSPITWPSCALVSPQTSGFCLPAKPQSYSVKPILPWNQGVPNPCDTTMPASHNLFRFTLLIVAAPVWHSKPLIHSTNTQPLINCSQSHLSRVSGISCSAIL